MQHNTPLLDKWRFFLKDYESPDSFIEWSYYALISAALQRRVWLDEEPRQAFGNMYILFIGPPACGKSLTIAAVGDLLRHGALCAVNPISKALEPKIPVAPDSITLEALTQALARDHMRTHKYHDNGKDLAYVHCSLQFICEELGVLLKKHTEDMVNVLIQGYDARQLERVTKGAGKDMIKNICLGMLAATTPTFMANAFSERLIGEGFSSRFVMIFESEPRFRREHPGFTAEQRAAWADIFIHINKRVTLEFGQCRFTPDAAAWRKEYYESGQLMTQRRNMDVTLDHYYSRKNLIWKKLSLVQHFSEDYSSREITLDTVQRSLDTLNRIEDRMHLAFTSVGKNTLFNAQQQILRTIRQAPSGVHRSTLLRLYTKDLSNIDFDNCLAALVASGQAIKKNDVFIATQTVRFGVNGSGAGLTPVENNT